MLTDEEREILYFMALAQNLAPDISSSPAFKALADRHAIRIHASDRATSDTEINDIATRARDEALQLIKAKNRSVFP